MARILIRVDRGAHREYGPVTRMTMLARVLAQRGHTILIASHDRLDRTSLLDPAWKFARLPEAYGAVAVLALIRRYRMEAIVADLPRHEPPTLAAWRAEACLAVFDEKQTQPLPADLLINPQIAWRDTPADCGQKILGGPAYTLLAEDVVAHVKQGQAAGEIPSALAPLVITMGESDPHNLTSRVAQWMSALPDRVPATILTGSAYCQYEAVEGLAALSLPFTALQNVSRRAAILSAHRAAVTTVDATLYELAALGIPTLCLIDDPRQEPIARALEQRGVLVALTTAEAEAGGFADALETILHDAAARARMAAAGRALVDGRGAERLAVALEGRLKEKQRAVA